MPPPQGGIWWLKKWISGPQGKQQPHPQPQEHQAEYGPTNAPASPEMAGDYSALGLVLGPSTERDLHPTWLLPPGAHSDGVCKGEAQDREDPQGTRGGGDGTTLSPGVPAGFLEEAAPELRPGGQAERA